MRFEARKARCFSALAVAVALAAAPEYSLAQASKVGELEISQKGWHSAESQFRLFGDRDWAFSGLGMVGGFAGTTDNSGWFVWSGWDLFHPQYPKTPDWFGMYFYWAVPGSERNKHAENVPSLANARGKGYTVNSLLSAYTSELWAHDGTLGPHHSGVATTDDGSCREQRELPPGEPMLAVSNCLRTWGTLGWQGSHPVDADGFLAYSDMVGDRDFAFDPWRVPEGLRRSDKLLGNLQTYGFFSDYTSEVVFGAGDQPSYGNVIPELMGGDPLADPMRSGWPLGLLTKMDAFSFSTPGLTNTGWWQFTMTNNSREVYGIDLDYDSLYLGVQIGWWTVGQATSNYRDPANGVVRGATPCWSDDCNGAEERHHPNSRFPDGTLYGAEAVVILKSPIGDLRNKLLTDPASPFFGKGDSEIWDDTITFNHGHMCGYHSCSATTWNAAGSTLPNTDYEQRQFGMVASIPGDVLGDRAVGDPADHTMWDTFRWEEYPDRNQLDFNKWVPGAWDYDSDGIPDTLYFDDCSDKSGPQFDPVTGLSKHCAVTWSDTLPGGFGNVYSNAGAVTGVGPFSMRAGDTVQWVMAVVMAADSVSLENDIAKAVDHYMNFYLGPEPVPAPNITSVDVQAGGETESPSGPQATVAFYFDDTAESWTDPFLEKFLEDLLEADPETELGKLRQLNPWLVDTVAALVSNNIEVLHVFKSCDGGRTFTDDADCFADPATDPTGIFGALGWLPWQTLEPDSAGNFDNVVFDDEVLGGRQYLYSLLTQTRGLAVSVRTGEPGDVEILIGNENLGTGDGVTSNYTGSLSYLPVIPASVVITDGTQTVTDDGGGNLVGDVDHGGVNTIDYNTGHHNVTFLENPSVGASIDATYRYGSSTCIANCGSEVLDITPKLTAAINTNADAGNVIDVYVPVSNQSGAEAPSVTLLTGSPDFVPFERMNVTSTALDVRDGEYSLRFGDQVVVTEVAVNSMILETTVEIVAASDTTTLTSPGAVGVEGEFELKISSDTTTRVWSFTNLAAVLADSDGVPLTVTEDLTGGMTVPGRYFGLPNFPGFIFSVDNRLGGSFGGQYYRDTGGDLINELVEPALTFLEAEASGVVAEGRYRVTWTAPAYGEGSPFFLDFLDPDGTRAAVLRSLEGRALGQTASTDTALALILGLQPEWMLPVRLPWTIENVTDPDNPTPVHVVITEANKVDEILLGVDLDTLTVTVPETEWVPGDVLTLIESATPGFEITFETAKLGCLQAIWQRITCNPVTIGSRGATGYISNSAGQQLHFSYYQTITSETGYAFSVNSASTGSDLVATSPESIRASLDSVKVVPNPFVMFSAYSTEQNIDRIIFTHVPPKGVLRIFTAVGQFVQELRWTPDDLNARGDLWFNLRTREGLEMAAGLYLFVLQAYDERGREIGRTKGKFVLIK